MRRNALGGEGSMAMAAPDGDPILAPGLGSVGASWRSRERARRRVIAGGPGQGPARVIA